MNLLRQTIESNGKITVNNELQIMCMKVIPT
jgi:hypothetical protein